MMYLVRREHGKLASRPYQVFMPQTAPRAWEFLPHLGYERESKIGTPRPSALCRPGYAALGKTPTQALTMLHSAFPAAYE